ncbi:MAG: HD domain-containing protein [Peptococcaceae bacterium]|nr:HD domain-containing protein [Peptococcaceae bacterium]MDH7525668.1 HD domain-containing protein [Peptococcaceae bacterium]
MSDSRIDQQVRFVIEIDRLKTIFRQSYLADGSRKENDAEHSWHLAVMALILAEHFPEEIDLLKVLKMTLMHDLVEIEAGDTYCYDGEANCGRFERERQAADRLYRLLPKDQAEEFYKLWVEFEECKTPEARFSAALDRLQPLLLNFQSKGKSWLENNISCDQVLVRNEVIKENSDVLWNIAVRIIDEAAAAGYLAHAKGGRRI